jgi:branched-chain amino acid transport system ATP-binding protein
MTEATPYLQVSGMSKTFGGLKALNDCSFAIDSGKIICLVGPNGAGKTTVFNAITGFLRLDEGTMTFRGRSLNGSRPPQVVKVGIARTFQNLRLFEDLTALENVSSAVPRQFGGEPFVALFRPLHTARGQARTRERAREILTDVGLAAHANTYVRQLSYGEQKLLCIARVLATGAELLLLDEPTSGLSGDALEKVIALLHRLRSEGRSQLVVEHNTRVVQQIADEVLFLHQGHLLAQGSVASIMADPHLAEIYFGGAL